MWVLAIATGVAGAADGQAAAVRNSISSEFFAMSPIRAEFVPTAAATQFSVALRNVSPGNQPNFRWSLTLDRSAVASATRSVCEDEKLAGGHRIGADEFVWANQGPSFLWYATSGAKCAGLVTVVAENEYEHCTASLEVPLPSPDLESGRPASCELGGYTIGPSTLPVPARLLKGYAVTSSVLAQLAAETRRGTLPRDRLVRLVDTLLARQRSSIRNLFPPVYGCRFSTVFQPLVGSATAVDEQLAQLRAGKGISDPTLAIVTTDLSGAVKQLRLCEGPAGAPGSVVSALQRVVAQARTALQTRTSLDAKLTALASSLDAALERFPSVFGVPYRQLVDELAALDSGMALAKEHVRSGDIRGAAGALSSAVAPSTAMRKALVHHQKQVIKAENANG
jgi:hypothetical protein